MQIYFVYVFSEEISKAMAISLICLYGFSDIYDSTTSSTMTVMMCLYPGIKEASCDFMIFSTAKLEP